MTLEMHVGMASSQANSIDWRGTDQGAQLKTQSWGGTNASGFSALPGGARYNVYGDFNNQVNHGYWWTSSTNEAYAWFRYLSTGNSNVYRNYHYTRVGFSVRCVWDSETGVCHDPDGDGICAENEVSGCTDSTASNFNPEATEEDESCEYPGPAQCGGQSTVTFDGYTYALVGIGTQCWFKENLRSDNYRNGDPIPGELSDSQWSSTTSGAQTVYGEGTSTVDSGSDDEVANLSDYGRLYNFHSVIDPRGLCPASFHVPSDVEWTILANAVGGENNGATELKSQPPSWDGTNSSGFSALPGGYRLHTNGFFYGEGSTCNFWSNTGGGSTACYRTMDSGQAYVYRNYFSLRNGFSVRCVKD
jgi:uncharacterized protein (TIGR02145 family)